MNEEFGMWVFTGVVYSVFAVLGRTIHLADSGRMDANEAFIKALPAPMILPFIALMWMFSGVKKCLPESKKSKLEEKMESVANRVDILNMKLRKLEEEKRNRDVVDAFIEAWDELGYVGYLEFDTDEQEWSILDDDGNKKVTELDHDDISAILQYVTAFGEG